MYLYHIEMQQKDLGSAVTSAQIQVELEVVTAVTVIIAERDVL